MVIVMMNDDGLKSPEQIKAFLDDLGNTKLTVCKESRNAWMSTTLKRTGYTSLSKKDKGIVFEYLLFMTNLSRQQISRLILNYRKHRSINKKNYGVKAI